MPSGKRARQQRQAAAPPPPVRSKGAPRGPRQASPRTLLIGGAAVALVAIAIVLGVVLSGGNSSSAGGQSVGNCKTSVLQGACYVQKLFKGIPEHGLVLGNPKAPATLTEYIDLQCPVCQEFESTLLPTILTKYVRPGKLNIKLQPWDIRDFPGGPQDSARGQAATDAATLQNKAFQFAEVLYLNQGVENSGWLTPDMVRLAAGAVDNMKVNTLVSDMTTSTVTSIVSDVDASATQLGLNATPSLLLNTPGKPVQLVSSGYPSDVQKFEGQIAAAIAAGKA